MLNPKEFTKNLLSKGYDFVSGVPCSLLTPLINEFTLDENWRYFSASNEGLALGMAAGALIGGGKPVIFMQNSGLGNAIDGLTSLTAIQKTPVLLLISWRGEPGTGDEPQHDEMGRILLDMLKLLGISFGMLAANGANVETLLDEADRAFQQGQSFTIIIKERTFAAQPQSRRRILSRAPGLVERASTGKPHFYPSRLSIVHTVQKLTPEMAGIVTSTGKMGRELLMINDGPRNLYIVGSMGLASMVGLGISLFTENNIIVLDGDGSVLMHMGALAMMGSYAAANLIHIVLDNGAHDSTGGQETIAKNVGFTEVATHCGFYKAFESFSLQDFETAFASALSQKEGPISIHAHVAPGSDANLPRPRMSPADNVRRFRAHLQSARAI